MTQNVESQIVKWLKLLNLPVSAKYVKERLLSHPDYPSILSITDTLDELGIENTSLVVDKERFFEIPVPFLVHQKGQRVSLKIVTDVKRLLGRQPDFLEKWDGIALVAEAPLRLKHRENEEKFVTDRKKQKSAIVAGSFLLLLLAAGLFLNFSMGVVLLLFVTSVGVGVSILTVQHELGIANEFTEQLCSAGKDMDCDAVLNGRKPKWLSGINLSDASLIWFTSVLAIVSVAIFSENISSLFAVLLLPTLAAVPITLGSLFYQWRIVKKWCTLCLLIILAIWLQILALAVYGFSFKLITAGAILQISLIIVLIATGWYFLHKPVLEKRQKAEAEKFALLRFKHDLFVFMTLLYQRRKIDASTCGHGFQLGNPNSHTQLLVVCSPYCNPCGKTHEILDEILDKNNIGLTVHFAFKSESNDVLKKETVIYLLQVLKNSDNHYKKQALNDWFKIMDLEKYKSKYPLTSLDDVSIVLKEIEDWNNQLMITHTPTIFINGNELPKQYKNEDLSRIIPRLHANTTDLYASA